MGQRGLGLCYYHSSGLKLTANALHKTSYCGTWRPNRLNLMKLKQNQSSGRTGGLDDGAVTCSQPFTRKLFTNAPPARMSIQTGEIRKAEGEEGLTGGSEAQHKWETMKRNP